MEDILKKNNMMREEVRIRPEKLKPLVVGNQVFKSAHDWELTEKELEKARIELGETEEKKVRCLQELKTLLLKDTDMCCRTDDAYLLRFLRFKKYDCEKAYRILKDLHRMRKNRPELFALSPYLKTLLDLRMSCYLPYTDDEGRLLLWVNVGNYNPNECLFEDMLSSLTAMHDVITGNPRFQINGTVGLWDASGITTSHMTAALKKNRIPSFASIGNCTPWRVKRVIIFNANRLAQLLFNAARPVLKKTVADRVIVLGSDVTELHQYVNPAILPKALGGELDEEECNITQHIMDNLPYLRYERSFVSE